jgi:hypothetical protein
VFGQLGQASISLAYYPQVNRNVGGLFSGWAINQVYNMGWNQLKEFTPDLGRVSGFLTNDQLEAAKTAFANDFMARPAFAAQYNSLSNSAYVDALINTAAVPAGLDSSAEK